ncbi:MAG: hypothetical protein DRQ78_08280 [Epsilonproteobacteria bacterium]|nr:MAG: hypothetical protein DRQ78_08280 [Campylobacterota bacterium]
MRIGTDISIEVCRAEGYMVMDYPVHDFRKNSCTTDCRFTKSYPDYIREEMGWSVGQPIMILDVYLNWEDLYEMYLENKESIDHFIGGEYFETNNPSPYNLLNLASDIDMYCGLV